MTARTTGTAATLLAATLLAAPAAWAGPVFLTGHDPAFESQFSPEAQTLLRVGINFATGGVYDKRFLWVEGRPGDPGLLNGYDPGSWSGERGLIAAGLALGTDYDRANGREFETVNLANYSAIVVASSNGGLLTRSELDALIDRKDDIAAFLQAGGGVFAAAECDGCGQDLLGDRPLLYGYLPILVTVTETVGPYTPTPYGISLGLSALNLNNPTANAFARTGGLQVVDTDLLGDATTLAGMVGTDGLVQVPEPASLALLGVALVATGLIRRRRG